MNKTTGVIIGVGIIAIGIGIVFSLSSSEQNNAEVIEDTPSLESNTDEIVLEEPKSSGTEFSVELTEKIGIKNQ